MLKHARAALLCSLPVLGLASPPASAHPPLPVGCSAATLSGCVYSTANAFGQTDVVDLVLTDPARNNWQLPVRVRYPAGTSLRMPVIVYNHGGAASINAGRQATGIPDGSLSAGYARRQDYVLEQKFPFGHSTMNPSDCSLAVRQAHCEWMRSLGLAFVDAVAKNRASAKSWLASDAHETLTGGDIELHRR